MKEWLAPALVAVLVLSALPIQAEPIQVLQDTSGDVQVRTTAGGQDDPADRFASFDLTSFTVEELEDEIRFTLAVRSLQDAGDTPMEGGYATVDFIQHDQQYQLVYLRFQREPGGAPSYFSWLNEYDAIQDRYARLRSLDVEVDAAAGALSVLVDRDDIPDTFGASPLLGRQLHSFRAVGQGYMSGAALPLFFAQVESPLFIDDRMPDSGTGTRPVTIELGLAQTGSARLFSAEPFRASNGEATTFVFTVGAENTGATDEVFELLVKGTPATWDVTVPNSLVRIPAGEFVQLPILVSTPFAHRHGAIESFVAELHGQADPGSVGRVELGIRYLEIPQPTGHHNVVWLHSRAEGQDGFFSDTPDLFADDDFKVFMNAYPDDEANEEVPVPGYYAASTWGRQELADKHAWRIDLEPRLQIGIDFDMAKTGSLVFDVKSEIPRSNAIISGQLVHIEGQPKQVGRGGNGGDLNYTVIAEVTPTEPMEFSQGQTKAIELEIVPTREGNFVAHTKHAGLRLELLMEADRPTGFTALEAPAIMPGGIMTLPLNEYHDPVDDIFSALGVVQLRAVQQERMINPGEMALFQVELVNTQPGADTFDLALHGLNKEWANLLEPARMRMESGDEVILDVAVAPPADAASGSVADLILEVSSSSDPNVRSLVRLLALVDTSADHQDDTLAVAGVEVPSQPTPAGFVALFALAAAALIARRRQ